MNSRSNPIRGRVRRVKAMARGRLVAASDVGGRRELVREGDTGTLFRADPGRVADLLADRSGWDARRARARRWIRAERNWSSNILRYQPVYQRLVAAKNTGTAWSRSPASA